MVEISGRCLCGEVRYEGQAEPLASIKCYCTDCRRLSGTAHAAHLLVQADSIRIEGEVSGYDHHADSGHAITRMFCPTCGTHVYALNSGLPGTIGIRASTLDNPETFAPQFAVYASRAPSWDPVSAQIPAFDEMPPRRR